MRYEYYSNVALVSSVIVYALAMFAHAAEWAAARRVGGAEHGERELAKVAAAEMRSELVEGLVEDPLHRVLGPRDEAVKRHGHVPNDCCHGSPPRRGIDGR